MGPPSSGGSTVGEALNILEGYDLSAMSREEALHFYLEASRLSFADRNAYLGDSDFVDVPLAGLLSDCFAAERRSLITGMAATSPVARGRSVPVPGRRSGRRRRRRRRSTAAGTTTHLTVADRRRERRRLHVHDRVDRWQRDGGARLRVPAQQRADRLQLRLRPPTPTASRAASGRAAR